MNSRGKVQVWQTPERHSRGDVALEAGGLLGDEVAVRNLTEVRPTVAAVLGQPLMRTAGR